MFRQDRGQGSGLNLKTHISVHPCGEEVAPSVRMQTSTSDTSTSIDSESEICLFGGCHRRLLSHFNSEQLCVRANSGILSEHCG